MNLTLRLATLQQTLLETLLWLVIQTLLEIQYRTLRRTLQVTSHETLRWIDKVTSQVTSRQISQEQDNQCSQTTLHQTLSEHKFCLEMKQSRLTHSMRGQLKNFDI